MDFITGKGPSNRHEIIYFAEGTLGAIRYNDYKYRFIDQPGGWLGSTVKPDWPILVNLRLDPAMPVTFSEYGLSIREIALQSGFGEEQYVCRFF